VADGFTDTRSLSLFFYQENAGKLFKSMIQFNPGRLQGGGGSGIGLFGMLVRKEI
jgi:hypothetical protein